MNVIAASENQATVERRDCPPFDSVIGSAPSISPLIVSFSGGQTSGYMLRVLIDQIGKENLTVCFANTGKEHDATLDFVRDVETHWRIPVTWLEYCRRHNEHSWRVVNYETAARRNDARTPFDEMLEWGGTLPNVRGRGCSGQLKVRTIKRYLLAQGVETWTSYVGIRADESHRTLEVLSSCPKYITPKFPLNEMGVTYEMVNAFWDAQPFKLNIPNHKGNCDLCFLKAKWKRLSIMREEPASANWWIGWERKMKARMEAAGKPTAGAMWIDGVSYEGLLAESQHPELDFNEQDVPCSCAVGGYRDADDEGQNHD
jgi:3'-phosphoadenosine 5'-phosphosulfate sulfotransferase (PAPS reductase)/FAD synthetase